MRVLVVDAFSAKERGRKDMKVFLDTIKSAFREADVEGQSVDYEVLRFDEVDSYVFLDDSKDRTTILKRFDRLDFVFVAGDGNMLPWEPRMQKLFVLMRMCYVTGKALFGNTVAAKVLAFLTAGNGTEIRVINGSNGGTLSELYEHGEKYRDMVEDTTKDVFLDQESGDLFSLHALGHQWLPHASSGMRYVSKQHTKLQKYKPKAHKQTMELYLNQVYSQICIISRRHVQHWVFQGIEDRCFVVNVRSKWMLDAHANLRCENRYECLAEGPYAPLILEKDNSLCVHFDIDPRHPETLRILSNFVSRKTKLLRHNEFIDQSCRLYMAWQTVSARHSQASTKNMSQGLQNEISPTQRRRGIKSSDKHHPRELLENFTQTSPRPKVLIRSDTKHKIARKERPWTANISGKATLQQFMDNIARGHRQRTRPMSASGHLHHGKARNPRAGRPASAQRRLKATPRPGMESTREDLIIPGNFDAATPGETEITKSDTDRALKTLNKGEETPGLNKKPHILKRAFAAEHDLGRLREDKELFDKTFARISRKSRAPTHYLRTIPVKKLEPEHMTPNQVSIAKKQGLPRDRYSLSNSESDFQEEIGDTGPNLWDEESHNIERKRVHLGNPKQQNRPFSAYKTHCQNEANRRALHGGPESFQSIVLDGRSYMTREEAERECDRVSRSTTPWQYSRSHISSGTDSHGNEEPPSKQPLFQSQIGKATTSYKPVPGVHFSNPYRPVSAHSFRNF